MEKNKLGENPGVEQWSGGILIILGMICIGGGSEDREADKENTRNRSSFPKGSDLEIK